MKRFAPPDGPPFAEKIMSKCEEFTLNGEKAVRLTDASGASCELLVYGAHVAHGSRQMVLTTSL